MVNASVFDLSACELERPGNQSLDQFVGRVLNIDEPHGDPVVQDVQMLGANDFCRYVDRSVVDLEQDLYTIADRERDRPDEGTSTDGNVLDRERDARVETHEDGGLDAQIIGARISSAVTLYGAHRSSLEGQVQLTKKEPPAAWVATAGGTRVRETRGSPFHLGCF